MMMDKTAPKLLMAPQNTRIRFFQWMWKWVNSNKSDTTDKASLKHDIPNIICLLQAIGFKLSKFDKNDYLITNVNPLNKENIRITMECGTSQMIAVLEMDGVSCECPNNNTTVDGSFWSITGTGPMGSNDKTNEVEQTGSNLLPEMSQETRMIARDVTNKILKLISNKCDINQNSESNMNLDSLSEKDSINSSKIETKEGLMRSFTDITDDSKRHIIPNFKSKFGNSKLNTTKDLKDSSINENLKLNREGTYECDNLNDEPRTLGPPKLTSSPDLNQFCTSLGQISLQSDEEEPVGLADYVIKAHQILDKAVNFIIKKLPINTSLTSIADNTNVPRPTPLPLMSSSFCVGIPNSEQAVPAVSAINKSTIIPSKPKSASSITPRINLSTSRALPVATKPQARRSVGMASSKVLPPPMRDRSSSLSSVQRPQLVKSQCINASFSTAQRTGSCNLANTSFAQRNAAVKSKLPSNKIGLTSTGIKERSVPTLKCCISPNPSPIIKQQRANCSLIKAPSSSTRLSAGSSGNTSSKFGYSTAKK